MKKIRNYFDLPDATASDIAGQLAALTRRLERNLESVKRIFAVMSGKGGVGKSFVTANLATVLAREGLAVGVLDADLNGPCMARLLGAERKPLRVTRDDVQPGVGAAGVKVMSMDLLLAAPSAPVEWTGPASDSFVWRGTVEANTLRQFLSDTAWGELDYLILDVAPGTDRISPIHDLLPGLGGVIIVTVPTTLSHYIVGKSLTMARQLDIPIIGYVENMKGYVCPSCESVGPLFQPQGSGFEGVARLGEIPFDPKFGAETDRGRPAVLQRPDSVAGREILKITVAVREYFEERRR